MLYASIALVVGGLVLIAYSFAVRSRHIHPGTHHENELPDQPSDTIIVPVTPVTDIPEEDKRHIPVKPGKPSLSPVKETAVREEKKADPLEKPARTSAVTTASGERKDVENRSGQVKNVSVPARNESDGEKDTAVLYADSSGVVDYESGANTIDPTFKKYSKLRRIGKGKVEIIKDGLNFQLRKKLFRFDFYRIQKLVTGKNYLALFIKGSEEVRLMIFEGDGTPLRRIINDFNSFRKRSM